jgi:cell division protein FtsL
MDRVIRFTQAYSQAPWRKQLQGIGIFLILLVIVLLIASIFVSITARTAAVGREIQRHRLEIEELEYEIADQQSQLAWLTSASTLKSRALEMGFRPAAPGEITYLVVPGYSGRGQLGLTSPVEPTIATASSSLSPDFTQSWVERFAEQLHTPLESIAEVRP